MKMLYISDKIKRANLLSLHWVASNQLICNLMVSAVLSNLGSRIDVANQVFVEPGLKVDKR